MTETTEKKVTRRRRAKAKITPEGAEALAVQGQKLDKLEGMDELDAHLLRMPRVDMMELELYQAQSTIAIERKTSLIAQEQLLKIDYQNKVSHNRNKQAECVRDLEESKERFNQARERIQQELGIDLSKYSVRDDGTLIEDAHGDEETAATGE